MRRSLRGGAPRVGHPIVLSIRLAEVEVAAAAAASAAAAVCVARCVAERHAVDFQSSYGSDLRAGRLALALVCFCSGHVGDALQRCRREDPDGARRPGRAMRRE